MNRDVAQRTVRRSHRHGVHGVARALGAARHGRGRLRGRRARLAAIVGVGQPWLRSAGYARRTRTLVLFGFGVSALIGTSFYSVQRTSHVRLFAPGLAWFVFYAWQATIVLGGWSMLAGWNGGKEYAELEWPFDIAITVVWVGFAVVFFGTIAKRKIEADLHLELVLRRADHRRRDAAHREQPRDCP